MTFIERKAAIAGLLAIFLPFAAAHAQLGDLLKSPETGSSSTGALGGISNLMPGQTTPSTTNINNIAGVLEYCIKNNYLSGNSTASIEDSLKDKLAESPSSSNSNYTDGLKGILHSNDGNRVNLGGSGLKAAATKQICDTVLSTAKSML